jgi:uncharacterized protein YqgC (DUF456 family)
MSTIILMAIIALMLIGLIGSVLPFIPGSLLILLGAFIYAWYTDFLVVTWGTLVGFLGGAIGKIIMALTMIGIFLVKIIG